LLISILEISLPQFLIWVKHVYRPPIFYLIMQDRQKSQGGQDLWSALGFPYGPIGNLSAIGGDFHSGLNAFPVTMQTGIPQARQLTDTARLQLTDTTGAILTDVPSPTGAALFPSRNAAGILDKFNHSGRKPS
jgi:hypothetical protein